MAVNPMSDVLRLVNSKKAVMRRNSILNSAGAAIIFAICCCAACSRTVADDQPVVLKFASVNPPSNPIMQTFRFVEQEIEKRSGGEVAVELYDSGRLGGETDNVERLRLGTLEMADVATSVLGNFCADFFVFDLPFLFDDQQHQHRVLNGEVGRELKKKLEAIGLKGLAFYGIGTRNMYTKKPVTNIDELNGLKIRVMESAIMMKTINALGAYAIPLSFAELYNALQQDVVDGAENNPFQYLASGHTDICKYYARTEHFMVPELLLMSKRCYDALKPKHRAIIDAVVRDSQQFHRKTWQTLEKETYEKLQQAGATITVIDKAPFRAQVAGIYAGYRSKYDSDLVDRIERLK
jgi:tripartite ATP-independent transporter DctP family solute receptor